MATLILSLISETIGMYDGVWNKQFKLIKKISDIPEEEQVFTLRYTVFSTSRRIAKRNPRPRIETACQDRFSQEAKLCKSIREQKVRKFMSLILALVKGNQTYRLLPRIIKFGNKIYSNQIWPDFTKFAEDIKILENQRNMVKPLFR